MLDGGIGGWGEREGLGVSRGVVWGERGEGCGSGTRDRPPMAFSAEGLKNSIFWNVPHDISIGKAQLWVVLPFRVMLARFVSCWHLWSQEEGEKRFVW